MGVLTRKRFDQLRVDIVGAGIFVITGQAEAWMQMTRKLLMLLPLLITFVSAPAVAKQEAEEWTFFHVGARAAYALPFGPFTGEADSPYLHDLYLGTVPLWVDLELSTRDLKLRMGAFLQYAPGHLRGECDGPCGANDLSTGIQVSYHFAPHKRLDPWVGMGLGYEWTNLHALRTAVSYRGPALQLQAGGDYGVVGPVRVGPFVNLTVGYYSRMDFTLEGRGSGTALIQRRVPHFWLALGVRLQVG